MSENSVRPSKALETPFTCSTSSPLNWRLAKRASIFLALVLSLIHILSHYISHELIPLVMGYPAGWLVCSAVTLIYYRRTSFLSTRLVAEDGSKEDIQ